MSYSSLELRKRVEAARKIQQERYSLEEGINCNAQMTTSLIKKILRDGGRFARFVKGNK